MDAAQDFHLHRNRLGLESDGEPVMIRGMRVFATDRFVLPLPAEHTFPAVKYARLRAEVVAAGLAGEGDLLVPEAASDEEILRAHAPDYLERVREGTLSAAEVR